MWERIFGRDTHISKITKARTITARNNLIEGNPQGLLKPTRGIQKSTADGYLNALKSVHPPSK